MSRPTDPNLKNKSGIYKSRLAANQKYDIEKTESIRVRVPMGTKELIVKHQQEKHAEDPYNQKYKSLNSMIVSLLETELNQKLKD